MAVLPPPLLSPPSALIIAAIKASCLSSPYPCLTASSLFFSCLVTATLLFLFPSPQKDDAHCADSDAGKMEKEEAATSVKRRKLSHKREEAEESLSPAKKCRCSSLLCLQVSPPLPHSLINPFPPCRWRSNFCKEKKPRKKRVWKGEEIPFPSQFIPRCPHFLSQKTCSPTAFSCHLSPDASF